jgi:hypothetical protein
MAVSSRKSIPSIAEAQRYARVSAGRRGAIVANFAKRDTSHASRDADHHIHSTHLPQIVQHRKHA